MIEDISVFKDQDEMNKYFNRSVNHLAELHEQFSCDVVALHFVFQGLFAALQVSDAALATRMKKTLLKQSVVLASTYPPAKREMFVAMVRKMFSVPDSVDNVVDLFSGDQDEEK